MEGEFILLKPDQLRSLIRDSVREVLVDEKKNKQGPELLSFEQTWKWLKISPSTLNTWKRENKIPFKRLGKRVFFIKKEVLEALEDSGYQKLKEIEG